MAVHVLEQKEMVQLEASALEEQEIEFMAEAEADGMAAEADVHLIINLLQEMEDLAM